MDAFVVLLAVVVLATGWACTALASPTPVDNVPAVTAPAAISGVIGLWVLDGTNKLGTVPGGVTLRLRKEAAVNPTALHVSGFTGLNYYVSDALVDPGQQRFILSSKLSSTGKWGAADQMQFDKAFLDALDGVVRFQLTSAQGMTLTTLSGDTLHFRRISN